MVFPDMGNNPMVGATVAVAVAIEEAMEILSKKHIENQNKMEYRLLLL